MLVAAAGFYEPALRKAAARGAVTITPEDVQDDEHEFAVISKLAAPPVTVEPTLTGAAVEVRKPPGTTMAETPHSVCRADGTHADLDGIARAMFNRHFHGFASKSRRCRAGTSPCRQDRGGATRAPTGGTRLRRRLVRQPVRGTS